VPDSIANEMAADLTADIDEAEAEGASIEDVLGSNAFDARSFAASWAGERGVAGPAEPTSGGTTSRWPALAALAALAVALIGAVFAVLPIGSGSTSVEPFSAQATPGPPDAFAGHMDLAARGVHTLGVLMLVVGLLGVIAAFAWMRRPHSRGFPWVPSR
jgi:hypothetical protein